MKFWHKLISNRLKLLILVLTIGLVVLLIFKLSQQSKPLPVSPTKDNTLYIENSIIHIFGDTFSLSEYPNRMAIHYPYLLIIEPNKKTTHIYNLETIRKDNDFNDILLDFDGTNKLINIGKTSYLNGQNLDVLCEQGFIKSPNEILCLTKNNSNSVENKVVSINFSDQQTKDIYKSDDLITSFTYINDKLYLGEIDLFTKQNYLIIDKERIKSPNILNVIYEIKLQPYFVSLKSPLNNNQEKIFLIENNEIIDHKSMRIL